MEKCYVCHDRAAEDYRSVQNERKCLCLGTRRRASAVRIAGLAVSILCHCDICLLFSAMQLFGYFGLGSPFCQQWHAGLSVIKLFAMQQFIFMHNNYRTVGRSEIWSWIDVDEEDLRFCLDVDEEDLRFGLDAYETLSYSCAVAGDGKRTCEINKMYYEEGSPIPVASPDCVYCVCKVSPEVALAAKWYGLVLYNGAPHYSNT